MILDLKPVRMSQTRALSALKRRNIQLYFLGMFVSLAGNATQGLAQGWLVYQLSNSPFTLGLVGFLAAIPLAPLSLLAGAISDRVSRRRLLAVALVGESIPPLVLATLVATGHVQVWHVVVSSIVLGGLGSVDFVSRLPLVQSMVEPDELASGFAVADSLTNVARTIGPAIWGLVIATVGVAGAFIFNSLSFLFVLLMLALMQVPAKVPSRNRTSLAANLAEVPRYIVHDHLILILFLAMMVTSLFVLPIQVLLPVFARDILATGPVGLGFLSAAGGTGAILSDIVIANQPPMSLRRRLLLMVGLMVMLSPLIALFGYSHRFAVSALAWALINAGYVALGLITSAHIYLLTPDRMRGRLSSIVQLGVGATQNVGSTLEGFIASRIGASVSVALGGLFCLLFGLLTLGLVSADLKTKDIAGQAWLAPTDLPGSKLEEDYLCPK